MNPDYIIIGMAVIGFAGHVYLLVQTGRILDDEFFDFDTLAEKINDS